ncbi:protein GVQW3-like [Aphis craccivora]|uniref:Protein GVQW3-like n=1 Tax=Aphis craccivora TaxID=307492 RepID=A0A6G0YK75_APHCR|nr:protein GVQW3-like [Aphis craccivora]
MEVLKRLCPHVRPKLAKNRSLYHDNASDHTSLKFKQFLTSKNITKLPHPPYNLDLTPLDFRQK